ncbi:MAG: glycerophosphodiester phosphodiesterase [Deltaproteobacteria bacterium]|nr:glycerophosphodiester phosphodiesterase [Deltaproteobacteria bacterium]MBW2255746.1 glycerophosphodiester phosphodiesterase [Deltaproteobacteria bacterium]
MSPIAIALAALLVLVADADAEPLPEAPTVIAHRGASAYAPENTMAAFEEAAQFGVGFELDVTLCNTGEVVVIHDDTVDRTTEGSGTVADLTLAEIKGLDAGSYFDPEFTGESIPTLDEVLATYGGRVPIDIEIKSTTPREPLADAVVAAIERAGLVEEVFVTSFDPYMLERVKEQNPDIYRGQLTGTFKDADLCFIEKLFLRNMWLNGKSEPDAIAVERVRAKKRFVKRQHRKGREVLVWTVNTPTEMERLLDLGVDGIITDYPDVLLEMLEGRESPSASTP